MHHDVFNGDADGLCALHQLRLAEPLAAELVTGVKRDIRLLERVQAHAGERVTVLDISLHENRPALLRLLQAGARVQYFDHHFAGDVPAHPGLEAHLDLSPDVCTSLLVDRHLQGAHRAWAVVAAFGDGLPGAARLAAQDLRLNPEELRALEELGTLLNYNAYGETLADLHVPPAELYAALKPHVQPASFWRESPTLATLRQGYAEDLARAEALRPALDAPSAQAYVLPAQPWARRVQGVLANRLAQASPARATALLVPASEGGYSVSVRAPVQRPSGADALCRGFAGGGGRAGAAGINGLPAQEVPRFLAAFEQAFQAG